MVISCTGTKSEKETGAIVAQDTLATYCPDLAEWPALWHYEELDLLPGQQIVDCVIPFLLHLLSLGLSPKTLRKHRDNLWLLGGELIREL